MRDWVKLTIQLTHGDSLGVDHCDLYLVFPHQVLREETCDTDLDNTFVC